MFYVRVKYIYDHFVAKVTTEASVTKVITFRMFATVTNVSRLLRMS